MQNIPYGNIPQGHRFEDYQGEWNTQHLPSTNRFIYLRSSTQAVNRSQTVLVNPHFKATSKVFVNPNFNRCTTSVASTTIHVNPRLKNAMVSQVDGLPRLENKLQSTKIHINPNAKNIQMPAVHINPKFTNVATSLLNNTLSTVRSTPLTEVTANVPPNKPNKVLVLTKTKLIRTPHVSSNPKKPKRRNSVKSKYKIVKTSLSPKKNSNMVNSISKAKNRYKLDNRRRKSLTSTNKHQKKYVYVNKLVSTSDLAKSRIIRSVSPLKSSRHLININGIVYRNSRTSLRRATGPSIKERTLANTSIKLNTKILHRKSVCETKHKIVKKFKVIRKHSPKKIKISLKKCNIPCPSYKKYGICKGKDNGKCIWKHDPDQIALCTRFLQGACIKEKCFLSHNVSPEKMPTCKYYLEGSCSKEDCPYLHVKISPKAEVCRDFLEGFCKKAAECDKRHQYLCPDYEKYGKCVKQRCAYPHGKMVRTYLINKNKFAKKSSEPEIKSKQTAPNELAMNKIEQANEKRRYYIEKKSKSEENLEGTSILNGEQCDKIETVEQSNMKNFVGLHSRPKLGSLPAFIPFGEL